MSDSSITALLRDLQIDRASPVPIYHQLVQKLTLQISSGRLQPGQRLPSETELSTAVHISPMTARQALIGLEAAGLIQRKRGSGSFVLGRSFDRPLDYMVGFTDDMRARGITPGSRILRFETAPAPDEAVARGLIDAGTPMLRVKRVRLANGQPSALHDAYFQGVSITREQLERAGSLYKLMSDQGVTPPEAEEVIDALQATNENAALLNVPEHSPLLRTLLYSFYADGRLCEFTIALYRADLYQFRVRLKQAQAVGRGESRGGE